MPPPLPAHSAAGGIVLAAAASVVTAAVVSRWQRRATDDRLAKLEAEVGVIVRALKSNDNNRAGAARDLGISRVTLYNKMKKFGLLD